MESLSATVDARDAYTAGPSRLFQQLALAIGPEPPLGARIILVAAAPASMPTTRISRAARPATEALNELRQAAGPQFCPRCVSALERILPVEEFAASPRQRGAGPL